MRLVRMAPSRTPSPRPKPHGPPRNTGAVPVNPTKPDPAPPPVPARHLCMAPSRTIRRGTIRHRRFGPNGNFRSLVFVFAVHLETQSSIGFFLLSRRHSRKTASPSGPKTGIIPEDLQPFSVIFRLLADLLERPALQMTRPPGRRKGRFAPSDSPLQAPRIFTRDGPAR